MTTKNMLCIKWGTKYGGAYVNRLYEGVRENLSGELRFVCLTDDPSGLCDEVALPLPVTPFDEEEFDRRPGGSTAESGLVPAGGGSSRGYALSRSRYCDHRLDG